MAQTIKVGKEKVKKLCVFFADGHEANITLEEIEQILYEAEWLIKYDKPQDGLLVM